MNVTDDKNKRNKQTGAIVHKTSKTEKKKKDPQQKPQQYSSYFKTDYRKNRPAYLSKMASLCSVSDELCTVVITNESSIAVGLQFLSKMPIKQLQKINKSLS